MYRLLQRRLGMCQVPAYDDLSAAGIIFHGGTNRNNNLMLAILMVGSKSKWLILDLIKVVRT
jgi:hypothetical protein